MEIRLTPQDLEPSIAVIKGRLSIVYQFKYGKDSEIALGYFFDLGDEFDKDKLILKPQIEVFDIFIRKLLGTPLSFNYINALYDSFLQNNGIKLEIE